MVYKNLKKIILFIFCSMCLSFGSFAQSVLSDSGKVLSIKDFFDLVKKNHPVARQASLFTRQAQAELLGAKGGFDPKLYGDYEQKYFDTKNYFSLGDYGFKIPTWYGVEVKGGYNTASGINISGENKLPSQGQAILGVSVPLLQNLMIDDRRANLFKARQSQGLYQAERDNLMNDMAIESNKTYLKWSYYYQQMLIFQQALNVANQRFRAIKSSYELGERMAMDTLESYTQVQDRIVQYNDARLDFQEASLKLANFLWQNETAPMNFSMQFKPENLTGGPLSIMASQVGISSQERATLVDYLSTNHPILKNYQFKMAQLEIEKRLKMEKFKPKLNFNYNILGNGFQLFNVFNDNYKWGISFSTSTLFRAERGDVQIANIKIENTRLFRDQKTLELKNKLQTYFAETDNLLNQIRLYQDQLANNQRLLELETMRFQLGESSFFLINSRESKVIDTQIKLVKYQTDYQIARANVDWAAGRLVF
jgi:outer membrane protein TolC